VRRARKGAPSEVSVSGETDCEAALFRAHILLSPLFGEASQASAFPEITRLLAPIHEWQDRHGKPGGRADAARRLDEAHKLLDEISDTLTETRREWLGTAGRG
jgi:hypothetical protein